MALQQLKQNGISSEDYLAGELVSDIKYEYIDGEVYAMTVTSINHNRIIGNLYAGLRAQLVNMSCEVFTSDIKVKAQNNFFYPDLIVDCERKKGDQHFTETPLIVFEVLSKTTRKLDQTLKRLAYQSLPSLQGYVLIEQDFVDVDVSRRSNHWQPEHYYLGDQVYLAALDLFLPVHEIYAKVDNDDMSSFLQSALA